MPPINDNSDAFDFDLGMAKPQPAVKPPQPTIKPPQPIIKPPSTELQKNSLNFDQKKDAPKIKPIVPPGQDKKKESNFKGGASGPMEIKKLVGPPKADSPKK